MIKIPTEINLPPINKKTAPFYICIIFGLSISVHALINKIDDFTQLANTSISTKSFHSNVNDNSGEIIINGHKINSSCFMP